MINDPVNCLIVIRNKFCKIFHFAISLIDNIVSLSKFLLIVFPMIDEIFPGGMPVPGLLKSRSSSLILCPIFKSFDETILLIYSFLIVLLSGDTINLEPSAFAIILLSSQMILNSSGVAETL